MCLQYLALGTGDAVVNRIASLEEVDILEEMHKYVTEMASLLLWPKVRSSSQVPPR